MGGHFVPAHDDVVFTEFAGRITGLDPMTGTLTVLGTGYVEPEDVAVSADGLTFFTSKRGGRVLANAAVAADRVDSTEIASGLGAVH